MSIAVFASGAGTNFGAIMNSPIGAAVELLYSDNPAAPAIDLAQMHGVRTIVAPAPDEIDLDGIDWIVLAGFRRILSENFVRRFRNRIVNIHPSLLPAFPGLRAVERAHAEGAGWTGVTVHEVIEEVDAGPIMRQEKIEIRPDEPLEELRKRIHAIEHRIYPPTIEKWIAGRAF